MLSRTHCRDAAFFIDTVITPGTLFLDDSEHLFQSQGDIAQLCCRDVRSYAELDYD